MTDSATELLDKALDKVEQYEQQEDPPLELSLEDWRVLFNHAFRGWKERQLKLQPTTPVEKGQRSQDLVWADQVIDVTNNPNEDLFPKTLKKSDVDFDDTTVLFIADNLKTSYNAPFPYKIHFQLLAGKRGLETGKSTAVSRQDFIESATERVYEPDN